MLDFYDIFLQLIDQLSQNSNFFLKKLKHQHFKLELLFLQMHLFQHVLLCIFLVFVIYLSFQPNRVSAREAVALPLAFHTAGTSWPENITNIFNEIVLSNFIRLFTLNARNPPFAQPPCRNFSDFCPSQNPSAEAAIEQGVSTLSSRSVAPWILVRNINPLRYPSEIWEACCACKRSCEIGIKNKFRYDNRPIKASMLVAIRENPNAAPQFVRETFTVGCTCFRNN